MCHYLLDVDTTYGKKTAFARTLYKILYQFFLIKNVDETRWLRRLSVESKWLILIDNKEESNSPSLLLKHDDF